jgi:hypothetical protein
VGLKKPCAFLSVREKKHPRTGPPQKAHGVKEGQKGRDRPLCVGPVFFLKKTTRLVFLRHLVFFRRSFFMDFLALTASDLACTSGQHPPCAPLLEAIKRRAHEAALTGAVRVRLPLTELASVLPPENGADLTVMEWACSALRAQGFHASLWFKDRRRFGEESRHLFLEVSWAGSPFLGSQHGGGGCAPY